MDLVNNILNLQQAKLASQVQFRVARKMLDLQQAHGAAAIQLIEAAARIAAPQGDALTAAATGLGGQLDTYA